MGDTMICPYTRSLVIEKLIIQWEKQLAMMGCNVNPRVIELGLLGGYSSNSHNMMLQWCPIEQLRVYESGVDIKQQNVM